MWLLWRCKNCDGHTNSVLGKPGGTTEEHQGMQMISWFAFSFMWSMKPSGIDYRKNARNSTQGSKSDERSLMRSKCVARSARHTIFFLSLKALKYICTSKQNEPSNSLVATLTQGSKKRHQIQYGSYRSTSIGTWSFTTAIRSRSHRNPKNKNRSPKRHQPACAYASIVIRGTLCKQCRGGFASWVWTVQKHSANTFFLFRFLNFMFGREDRQCPATTTKTAEKTSFVPTFETK